MSAQPHCASRRQDVGLAAHTVVSRRERSEFKSSKAWKPRCECCRRLTGDAVLARAQHSDGELMGTHLLQGMVRTAKYKRVVALLGDSAGRPGTTGVSAGSLEQVADATMSASLLGLEIAKADRGLHYCLYLLIQVTRAAAGDNVFAAGLEGVGISPVLQAVGLPDAPFRSDSEATSYSVFELTAGFAAAIDRQIRRMQGRTDLSELAQLAATESLSALCGDDSKTLFGTTEATVRRSLQRFSTDRGFARLAHDFFARLTRRYLEYHLTRELSNHVGARRRFSNVDEHNEFLQRLDRHCRTATSILKPFAEGWYGIHNFRDDLTLEKTGGFAAHALDKVREALRYQEGLDAA
jgi:hypothetical protein